MNDLSLPQLARRLRIYINEGDRWHGKPLDAALLDTLRGQGMAGATVFRGAAGFGAHAQIHSGSIEVLTYDLPVVIELVDTPEKIAAVLEVIAPMIQEGLVTGEDVQVLLRHRRAPGLLPAGRLVSDVMTTDVIAFHARMPVKDAWQQMLEHRLKAAPVLGAGRHVIGIVTDEDLLARAGIQQRLSVALRLEPAELENQLSELERSAQKIMDVMTYPVVTVLSSETLAAAAALMVEKQVKRLPVVDDEGQLVGMLSRLDVLRAVVQAPQPALLEPPPAQPARTVGEIMLPEIPLVAQDAGLPAMVEAFARHQSHRLVVVDSAGAAVGLVSDSDVVARVQPARRKNILEALRHPGRPAPAGETALDLMSPGPLTAPPDMSVRDAVQHMLRDSRKWLVVVDAQNRPLGLVDRQQLLEAVAQTLKLA